MLRTAKMHLASKLKGFLEYWSTQAARERISQNVVVLQGTKVSSEVNLGKYTYIGSNSMVESGNIGAFCSIANNVVIGVDDHSIHAVSSHPFWCSPSGWNFRTTREVTAWPQPKAVPQIGNDVWIGANVVVVRGAVIEDGAVIGAGAVVTGHIPAFAIAVGVPARVTRYRFDAETREKLLRTEWWSWDDERIDRVRPYFADPDTFLQMLDDRVNKDDRTEGTSLAQ